MLCWLQYWQTSFAVVIIGWFYSRLAHCGAFIDFDTQMLPDWSTIGLFIFGVAVSAAFPSLHGYDGDGELPALLLHMRSGVTGLIGAFVATGLIVWIAMLAEWF